MNGCDLYMHRRLAAVMREVSKLKRQLDKALAAVKDAQSFVNIEQHRAIIALANQQEKEKT